MSPEPKVTRPTVTRKYYYCYYCYYDNDDELQLLYYYYGIRLQLRDGHICIFPMSVFFRMPYTKAIKVG